MTKRFGFTLAEVLITLTIIGVIAAMTIPTLLSNTSDQEYKTGLKKAISTINQAITMQYALDGTNMADFTQSTGQGTSGIFNATYGIVANLFQQRMQVVSTTTNRATKGFGNTATTNAAIYLSDGMAIEFPSGAMNGTVGSKSCKANAYTDTNTSGCLYTIVVDVNGDKGNCNVSTDTAEVDGKVRPKDCFPLDVYADGVRPANWVGREIMYSGK